MVGWTSAAQSTSGGAGFGGLKQFRHSSRPLQCCLVSGAEFSDGGNQVISDIHGRLIVSVKCGLVFRGGVDQDSGRLGSPGA